MALVDGAAYERAMARLALAEEEIAFLMAVDSGLSGDLDRYKELADDLYDELLQESLGQPDPQRRRKVMARYRELRQR